MPFREAHGVIAALVRTALDSGTALSDLSEEQLAGVSTLLAEHREAFDGILTQVSWLESKVSEGGTALARVREQLSLARAQLDEAPGA
jgi:argininosuccinate lyase